MNFYFGRENIETESVTATIRLIQISEEGGRIDKLSKKIRVLKEENLLLYNSQVTQKSRKT